MIESQVARIVAMIMAAYPNSRWEPANPEHDKPGTSTAYETMLRDLDGPAATAAVARLIAISKFPPTVAEIREATLALQQGEIRPGGEAWGDVLKAIGRYGRNRAPGQDFTFGDPVVNECVAALKWREICDSENQEADRARFIQLYDRLAAQRRRSELSESLPAVQRYRELQEQRRRELEAGEPQPIGKLLVLPVSDEP